MVQSLQFNYSLIFNFYYLILFNNQNQNEIICNLKSEKKADHSLKMSGLENIVIITSKIIL